MCKSETEQPEEGTKMAATHKSLQLWIDRESRIVRDAIADGNAEEAAIFARILFQTTAKRYHIREPRHFDGTPFRPGHE
jgi:hypothetical protein